MLQQLAMKNAPLPPPELGCPQCERLLKEAENSPPPANGHRLVIFGGKHIQIIDFHPSAILGAHHAIYQLAAAKAIPPLVASYAQRLTLDMIAAKERSSSIFYLTAEEAKAGIGG